MKAPKRPKRRQLSTEDYVQGVLSGNRMILGRAISLVESNASSHRAKAQEVLTSLMPHTGKSHRIGITGVPGVGKSTFIERFGMELLEKGHRVAVLAVDPSSSVKGGSILGDKTRMSRLAADERAFIRPSPTQGSLGGVHRKTRETLLLCEAAGFDIILVETVGVGQSETLVSEMVDTYLVLMLAGAGDELQGIKKGILEVADILAINKADGNNALHAKRARSEYKGALRFMNATFEAWKTPVLTCSGLEGNGLKELWEQIQLHRQTLEEHGEFSRKRQKQRLKWTWDLVEQELLDRLRNHPEITKQLPQLESDVLQGVLPPTLAAQTILDSFTTA